MFDFDDWRVSAAIKREVEALPADFDRTVIKALLAGLKKRNRFIYRLTPNYSGHRHDSEVVLQQASALFLDLLLIREANPMPVAPGGIEIATLANYQHTSFEAERARLATEGRTSPDGALAEQDFLDQHFRKALRYATRIEICDKIFGTRFADNYIHTTTTLFHWLAGVLADPAACRVVFHCGKPDGNRDHYLVTQLRNLKQAYLASTAIDVQFYQLPNPNKVLPHERFVLTDQIALEIGRGMDFLDAETSHNRNVSVGCKSMKEVHEVLHGYGAFRLPVIAV